MGTNIRLTTSLQLMLARRSLAVLSLPVIGGLLSTQLLMRGVGWRYDWLWAFYNYHFVTVMLGPAIAGVACIEGSRWARASEMLVLSTSPFRGVASIVAASWIVVVSAYLCGLLGACFFVMSVGTPGLPPWRAVSTIGPALALLLACTAIGVSVGLRSNGWLASPLLAIGLFAFVLVAYTNELEAVVRVGGATAALPNIAPRPSVQLLQCLFFGLVAGLCVFAPVRDPLRHRATRWSTTLFTAASLVAGLTLASQHTVFQAAPARLTCVGSDPILCLSPNFLHLEQQLRRAVTPSFNRARLLLPAARGYTQEDFSSAPIGLATFYPLDVLHDPVSSGRLTLNSVLDLKTCAALGEPTVGEAFGVVSSWLSSSRDSTAPPNAVRAAAQTLSVCAKP